jgi:hypothetical protein
VAAILQGGCGVVYQSVPPKKTQLIIQAISNPKTLAVVLFNPPDNHNAASCSRSRGIEPGQVWRAKVTKGPVQHGAR